jgi:SMI1 / KNR4 family (SUKH-1)
MEIENIDVIISRLVEFWRNQSIVIFTKTEQEIDNIEKNISFILPNDFREFYKNVNGMQMLYPNEIDNEGFLFYPVEAIISSSKEFHNTGIMNKEKTFIFAEYMHKSWWYGFELQSQDSYVIGIIPDKDTFKPITNSLIDFIQLYLEDSPKLYDYS